MCSGAMFGVIRSVPSGSITLHGSMLEWRLASGNRNKNKFEKLSRERLCAVFREHGGDDVDHDTELRLICRRNINEDVLSIQCDLAVVRVDDRWHRKDLIRCVIDDWVHRRVFDYMKIFRQMLVRLCYRIRNAQ